MLKKVYHVLFDRGHIENCGSLNFVRQLMIHLLGYYVIWVFSSQTWKWENQVKEPVHNKDFILSFLPIVSLSYDVIEKTSLVSTLKPDIFQLFNKKVGQLSQGEVSSPFLVFSRFTQSPSEVIKLMPRIKALNC